ncbi:MAG: hypothetical protein M1825_004873 [Sarcosagium campestre]|nr:MAG: hypothetical protein M1825_004873 [Sarcosagium campestre]
MGQESSSPIDEDTPPQTLEKRDIESVARYIKDGRARRIAVMVGAGISTSAGIPDFRSADTGLYANLARLDLPYAEAVFDISYFRQNPLPFYTLARELYPGKFRPTITHAFVRLLSDKGLLLKLFTQNIDCLEREAGVPDEKIVEAHGSFARQGCIDCLAPYPSDMMLEKVKAGEVPRCKNSPCNGLVKPGIVFFGEPLPEEFHRNRSLPAQADLCIVLGTSLTVQPFASLPGFAVEGVPRVLINLERVGSLGSRADDVLILGDCDSGVRKLASAIGWLEELEELWAKTSPKDAADEKSSTPPQSSDEKLRSEIDKLTEDIDSTLKLSSDHEVRVRDQLSRDGNSVVDKVSPSELQEDIPASKSDQSNKSNDTGNGPSSTDDHPTDDQPARHDTILDKSKACQPLTNDWS